MSVIRIELEVSPSINPDHEPQQCPTIELARHHDGFAMHELHVWDESPSLEEHCSPYQDIEHAKQFSPERLSEVKRKPAMSLASAWDWLISMNYKDDSVLLMVGPGESPITLKSPTFLPNHFRVWQADDAGTVSHVGDYFSRFSVMLAVKTIIDAGQCPVVASHYLAPDDDWDCLQVVRTSELDPSPIGV